MKLFSLLTILSISALSPITVSAASPAQRAEHYNLKSGVAIKGYDPVAYFTQNKAVEGSKQFRHIHQGVTYQFSSTENLAKFKKSPSRYEPQYGGWCAYAFAIDAGKVKVNPKSFKIIDAKLYLFYHSAPWGNTLKKWNQEGSDKTLISKANAAWAKEVK